jgi:hypothetical protein
MKIKRQCHNCKQEFTCYQVNGIPTSKLCKQCQIEKYKERKKESSLKNRIKEEDTKLSLKIRKARSNSSGYVQCYTCGRWIPISKIHLGHCFSRKDLLVRYNEDNVRPQCYRCNIVLRGNLEIFKDKLKEEIGNENFNRLDKKKLMIYKKKGFSQTWDHIEI